MNLKIIKFVRNNYLITALIGIVFLVGIIATYKLFLVKPTYVYAKVQVGQGLWWAKTVSKPQLWYVNSLKKGEKERTFTGNPIAQILSVRSYPTTENNEYNIYLTLKLQVNENKRTKQYTFNRNVLSVASPIDLQFPSVNVTGTIVELSPKPFKEALVDKLVIITDQGKNSRDFPELYDNIRLGDRYYDGEDYVIEVLDKKLESAIGGNQNIVITAKIKTREKDGQLIFAEEFKVGMNGRIPLLIYDFPFDDFVVRKIE